jgi:pimeloyl-ACP methyl ester carboxylesterase
MLIRQEIAAIELALAEDWERLESHLAEIILAQLQTLPVDIRAQIGDLEATAQTQANVAVKDVYQNPWFQFYVRHDPAGDWSQVQVPVLALYGEYDESVPPDVNIPPLLTALEEAGNSNVSVVVFPDTNHLFVRGQLGQSGPVSNDLRVVPELLDTITAWLGLFLD